MYQEHQPAISAWARAKPDNLARTIQFCVISARARFYNVPALIEDAERGGEEAASALFGHKLRAWEEAWAHREEIYWNCEDIWNSGATRSERADYLLIYLAGLYGLNTAKAGFACQLAYGVSGCLDTVNVSRLNLPKRFCPNFFLLKTRRGRLRRAMLYNGTVRRLGGTARLWDDWCAAISERYPAQFPSPYDASAWHLRCLGIT